MKICPLVPGTDPEHFQNQAKKIAEVSFREKQHIQGNKEKRGREGMDQSKKRKLAVVAINF